MRKETGNRSGNNSIYPEELQKSIITTTSSNTPANVDTTDKGESNNNSNSNYNNSKGINITQNRSRGFKSIRM
jgi:hypothetical protein